MQALRLTKSYTVYPQKLTKEIEDGI